MSEIAEAFEREGRYLVLKLKDTEKYLTETERLQLRIIADRITEGRVRSGKSCLQCVVVEEDWPMYEQTWQQIERWVNEPVRCRHKEKERGCANIPGPGNPPPRSCVRPAGHEGPHKDKYGHVISANG